MPERRAKLLEIGVGQLGEDLRIDFGVAEGYFVLAETEAPQSVAHVHDSFRPAQADNRQRAGYCKAKGSVSGSRGAGGLWRAAAVSAGRLRVSKSGNAQGAAFIFATSRLSDL
jgi:hypothetical protein